MTVDAGGEFLQHVPKVRQKLETLRDVGLGYIELGQSATTLSGGEAQRIKLSKELAKKGTGRTVYILDEPTTGLHFDDITQLLHGAQPSWSSRATRSSSSSTTSTSSRPPTGSSTSAPKAATAAATVVAQGTPEDVGRSKASHTGAT